MHTNPFSLQNIHPYLGQGCFYRAARGGVTFPCQQRSSIRGRQRLPVKLAIWQKWEMIQKHVIRGRHISRQTSAQEITQLLDFQKCFRLRQNISCQSLVTHFWAPYIYDTFFYIWILVQNIFNFFQFNPLTTQLNLEIDPAQVYNISIWQVFRQVPRSV